MRTAGKNWDARAAAGLLVGVLVSGSLATGTTPAAEAAPPVRPNVVLIALDDLNDWVGVFGGNPQARTPNLDRLARSGVAFNNAVCAGPVCGPSRSALLSGFAPHRSGVYGNNQNIIDSPVLRRNATLPEYFAKHGYFTVSSGKVFHRHPGDTGAWAFRAWDREGGNRDPDPTRLYSLAENILGGVSMLPRPADPELARSENGTRLSWGPTIASKEETPDYRTALWAAERIAQPTPEPIFLAVGFFKPHLPLYVPQEFFDLHPLQSITVPEFRLDDFADIRGPDGKPVFEAMEEFFWVREDEDRFRRAIQAYLAAGSYVDACVGVVLDAIEHSPARDHTIVVAFGDNGMHEGEKLRLRKATLWAESTRVPLIIRAPGLNSHPAVSPRPVNLQDIFPTLVELCALPAKPGIDGRSLVPLLRDAQTPWPHPAVVINGRGSACARDERWYYIRYEDGTEEFYDMLEDPMQWTNLAGTTDATRRGHMERLARALPREYAPPVRVHASSAAQLPRIVRDLDARE